jgi:SAM-dependent methyltransferase
MSIEALGSLPGEFDGVLSNFGALNCVPNLNTIAQELARLVRPAGTVALCVISRYCWSDWRHLLQRWSGHAVWRGVDVYYRSAASVARDFAPGFAFERRASIGRGDHQLLVFTRRSEC